MTQVNSLPTHGDRPLTKTARRQVVVFVDSWNRQSMSEHIEAVADAFPHWDITILQQFPKRRLSKRIKRKLGVLVRDPVSVVKQVGSHVKNKLSKQPPRSSGIEPIPQSPADIVRANVQYRRFSLLHGKQCLEYVHSLKPWLGLCIGAPILRKPLFSIPEVGTINIHKSLLPNYRGLPYGFWELHDGAAETGVTVHWVDEGLDTGPVIGQRALPIPRYATIRGLGVELDILGTQLLVDTLRRVDQLGQAVPHVELRPSTQAESNHMPAASVAQAVYRKCLSRRETELSPAGKARQLAKNVTLWMYVSLYCRVRNLFRKATGRCSTSILLFHRVSEDFLDPVTVGIHQFEEQIKHLLRHYDVIDVSKFLAERGQPRRRPAVVLTFDDGYDDNYAAAVLLRRYGVPCTFFVSTQIVGTDRAFPHDLKALGHGVPTLSWDRIRTMKQWGFQISNHTQTHPNLGEIPLETAIEEVKGARADLESQIGNAESLNWLAYPYGQESHINPDLRTQLPSLGIPYCFSAHGGTNSPDFDPLNILRQGVDHRFSLLRLRAAIEGWKA